MLIGAIVNFICKCQSRFGCEFVEIDIIPLMIFSVSKSHEAKVFSIREVQVPRLHAYLLFSPACKHLVSHYILVYLIDLKYTWTLTTWKNYLAKICFYVDGVEL
jgi:hypothetical protein